ncbi:tyrosine-type recombinase/integrase [Shimia marina]|uniref:Site-specific recombinase XerD n=1 Tax=Shimia marina TaxID=321267 RepID=A0A0P1FA45_9RHOB|nr:tyrosine-type recombinase/integrase [Shimia marina]CUH52725.1 Site-specific recombinase XerD [Shimia marina]SFE79893.1 Site-specific recombinase XerD [Shimia marina]
MALTMKIRHVYTLANGVLRFRRRFPKEVAENLGHGFLQVHIRNREGIAFQREYQAIMAEFDRIVSDTRGKLGERDPRPLMTRWHETLMAANDLVSASAMAPHEEDAASFVEGAKNFPQQSLNVPKVADNTPFLSEAVEKYRAVKRMNKNDSIRLDRTASRLAEAIGDLGKLKLTELRREHGQRFLDHLLSRKTKAGKPMAIGSVEKEITIARAMVNRAALEMDVEGFRNPFEKLELPKHQVAAVDAKLPLSDDHIAFVKGSLQETDSEDLRRAWTILAGTGARLGEISGLTLADIDLVAETPCIHIRPNNVRGLKTTSSVRSVPLVGEALVAAQVLVSLSDRKKTTAVFPRYAKERGADKMSAALMKHLRKTTKDKRFSVHGLRHALQDRLRLAGAPSEVYRGILGHS